VSGRQFLTFVYSPLEFISVELAIATTRYGSVGVVNAELLVDASVVLKLLDAMGLPNGAKGKYGLKLADVNAEILKKLKPYVKNNLAWLILDSGIADKYFSLAKKSSLKVLVECTTADMPACINNKLADGVIIKGNESGGYVGEESSFILLQKWAKQTNLPLYIRGGLTPHVAAACSAMGVAGGVLDSQVLLLEESPVAGALQKLLAPLSGSETVAVGDGENGSYFRLLNRPQLKAAKQFVADGEGLPFEALQKLVAEIGVNWNEPMLGLLPVGHDICFAEAYRKQYGKLSKLLKAINAAVDSYSEISVANPSLVENSPLAQDLGIKLPIIQGPMTRVSDTAEFANAVAEGGALPMLALAVSKGQQVTKLLQQTKKLMGEKPWGIGLLGFVAPSLLEEQINAALPFKPNYAIIAGGRPDQAVALEAQGIPSFLHLPSANLLANFLKGGARRFIFEGRECGGHIGPLSSFVLWSTMIDRLLVGLDECGVAGSDVQCIFAGGIHDEYSSALLQVMVAPLTQKGVKIGIIMGSAYLFTREIVEGGAIVPQFQKVVVECEHTVNLESGAGHASRCAYTPFAANFFQTRKDYKSKADIPADEVREKLDDLILGTLRMASKGVMRKGEQGELVAVNNNEQKQGGMYMLGQVVPLRKEVISIEELHNQVAVGARKLLEQSAQNCHPAFIAGSGDNWMKTPQQVQGDNLNVKSADIAIVGMSCALPGAKNAKEFWQNILDKKDSITEVPRHRWDWRLYFDEDRHAKDKVYSKWGGFLEDMVFDPMKYGITPKSIESVDPMQLMALEVAHAALQDAGFDHADAEIRAKTSVIIGASGGAGDVGMQYGLRAELPRFTGQLPEDIADNLPEWSEDTFAGILINVVAGRIANRLNLGGVNYTTDAACASSLTAVYQAVAELQNRNSDVVIAGGADTVQGPFGFMCFSQTQALSPTGQCRTFDETSDGIVISEGIVMLVLKRLEDAERDGDRIYSVIKGIGGGSDGKAKGLSAPLPEGQLRAMRRAYEKAGFAPNTISLFEAHGTGTVAGDTAELESTTTLVKASGGLSRQAVVGSVKTMIGHTKATAGIAGLMKASLSLYHKILPPHGFLNNPSAVLGDKNAPLYLLDNAQAWLNSKDYPRRAAASAFGFGGTNFHVVMEEYLGEYRSSKQVVPSDKFPAELFLFSGKDKNELAEKLQNIQNILAKNPDIYLRDLAFACAKEYNNEDTSIAIIATDFAQLEKNIAATLANLTDEKSALPKGVYLGNAHAGKLAVLFSGQGSQYTGMLSDVATQFPICSNVLSEADRHLEKAFGLRFGEGINLSNFVFPRGAYDQESKKQAEEKLKSTDVAQPALGAVEAAIWQLMQSFGLKADMLAGHSYGEFMAMYAANKIDFADLMKVSEARGRLIIDKANDSAANQEMQKQVSLNTVLPFLLPTNSAKEDNLGTMAAVKASRLDVEALIKNIKDVVIANHNAPQQVIISGSKHGIDQAEKVFANSGKSFIQIPVAAAFHSPFVEPAREALAEVINSLDWQSGSDAIVYSNNTAKPHADTNIKKAMANHLVGSVEFVAQIEAMYNDGARVFLELGPKNVLTKLVGQILGDKPHSAIAFDDNGRGVTGMLHAFGQLLCAGVQLDALALFAGRDCLNLSLENIESAIRNPKAPKHAWLLNGSGARRVGESVKQIGVTLEQSIQTNSKTQSSAAMRQETSQQVRNMGRKFNTKNIGKTYMNNHDNDGDNSITRAYFDLLARQLDNARDVALAELGVNIDAGARPAFSAPAPRANSPVQRPINIPAKTTIDQIRASAKVQEPTNNAVLHAVKSAMQPSLVASESGPNNADLKKIILDIVTEKTGYEADMIDFNQNLEADLGVDSIKRVDIVGTILEVLPDRYTKALGEGGKTKLSIATTLQKMLELLQDAGVTANANFNLAGAGLNMANEVVRHLPRLNESRFEMVAHAEPIDDEALRKLTKGDFIITVDNDKVAANLSSLLKEQGCVVHILQRNSLKDEAALLQWCEEADKKIESLDGVVHLAAFDSPSLAKETSPEMWKSQIFVNEKSLFLVLKYFSAKLQEDAHVLSVSSLGGFFGRDNKKKSGLILQGGAIGLVKSLVKEREVRGKALDLDPKMSSQAHAAQIFCELELNGGRVEVGYPAGVRTIFKTTAVNIENIEGKLPGTGLVILSTGGARGVTAEVLRELAKPGNTLILTGRSALPDDEITLRNNPEIAGFLDEKSLVKFFVKNEGLQLGEARKKANSILAAREILDNIADFENSGASVEYRAVDVVDEKSMAEMLAGIYKKYKKIDGVVHGAGIIEDKFLADITSESWSRVVDTKVIGLLLLQKYLDTKSLKFLTVFSSVAGRYGNSGQSNYATANELMNRICCQLKAKWGNVKVSALCWGPWGKTKFGAGMVNEATENKFAKQGVYLVHAELGRELFCQQLNADGAVEIICGKAPWEESEAARGAIKLAHSTNSLLGNAVLENLPKGEISLTFSLNKNHTYLQDHIIDGNPVLPMAVAMEMMAEAVSKAWGKNWVVTEISNAQLFKGVIVDKDEYPLSISMVATSHGMGNNNSVKVRIISQGEKPVPHYGATINVASELAEFDGDLPKIKWHDMHKISAVDAYANYLFHGECFQVIKSIKQLSPQGAKCVLRSTSQNDLLKNGSKNSWFFDPAIVDAAAHMSIIYTSVFNNVFVLPVKFKRVVRYVANLPQEVIMQFMVTENKADSITADVYFSDENGQVLLQIEGMRHVVSTTHKVGMGTKKQLVAA
jgi:acyl transferase domain-containing protein/NAD(P)H-dependent flavin oxidoreductase YrpB (nitropropane dioxygenase family)/NAD(P)-dependent dehydrogenase (short-subunit alcohol dehydrogenase family)